MVDLNFGYKNTILIVVFNYSHCVSNIDTLKKIYANHFKHIIFYADEPSTGNEEINFININRGLNTHKVFKHFYDKYKNILRDIDGIFYTMDDNILNVNILNLYQNNKILFNYSPIHSLDYYTGIEWTQNHGKPSLYKLLEDPEFIKYNINKFSNSMSDWFFLPKKYITDEVFNLFELFSKYNISLEIAIPSVINNIEQNEDNYSKFTENILWGDSRNKIYNDNRYIYNTFNQEFNLVLHPVKFKENPKLNDIICDIFCKEKCVIITTINKPTEAILKHINNNNYDTIIIGDIKTPDLYKGLKCIYLDISAQDKLFPELSNIIPYNHYCRKNLGYLYAIKRGYKVIYETDDDNIPYDNFDNILNFNNNKMIKEEQNVWINIFKYFTNNAHIWPRGFPLSLVKSAPSYIIKDTHVIPSIINGLVENDPDVDAIFRLTSNTEVVWEQNKNIIVSNENICVFNTQNTFWLNNKLFISMLIPSSVSFRYCDILRGIIANIILKYTNNHMMYCSPNVIQNRNEHNLISDFKSEIDMYMHNEKLLLYIENNLNRNLDLKVLLSEIYDNLLNNNVITLLDTNILKLWLQYFD